MAFSPSPPAPTASRTGSRPCCFLLCALAAALSAGCGQTPEITAYDAPKPDTKETPGKNRLLAAVLLHDETAWNFKVVGPSQVVADHEREFLDFLKSIRFDKDGQPTWNVPESWQRLPNRKNRFAAFQIEKGIAALELTIVPLPAEKGEINLLLNVNRWRRQLHRQSIDEATLDQFKRSLTIDGKEVPLVDLTGSGDGKTPRQPDEPEVVEVNPSSLKSFDKPDGWVETKEQDPKAAQLGIRRAAAFKVAAGNLNALVTVIPIPNTGRGAFRPNLDRWTDQLGLPRLTDEEAQAKLKRLKVDGIDNCFLIDLLGPKKGDMQEETLAGVVALNDQIWTFKMSGPAALVTSQKGAFEKFVLSAKFEGGR